MANEPHEAVTLLLARMKSHPEEFARSANPRWEPYVDLVNSYGNEKDTAAINAGMRDIRLAEVHAGVMEELCNGPERRAKEEADREYERRLMVKQAMQTSQYANLGQASINQYANAHAAIGQYQNQLLGPGIMGTSSNLMIQDEMLGAPTLKGLKKLVRKKGV